MHACTVKFVTIAVETFFIKSYDTGEASLLNYIDLIVQYNRLPIKLCYMNDIGRTSAVTIFH